jgi:hypothetical protein
MKIIALSKLQWVTGVYGLLYVVFAVLALIPASRGTIISSNRHGSMGLELALTELLCVLFLLGYGASWLSELLAGALISLWFALVYWMELFSIRFGVGGGVATVLALPGFILGILFLVSWFWRRVVRGARTQKMTP